MSAASGVTPDYSASPQYREGRFRNPVTPKFPHGRQMIGLWWKFLAGKRPSTRPPAPPPVQPLTAQMLDAAPDNRLYRLGHSTVLVKLDGGWWLTDPVFSGRASPFSWIGPSRFQAPPIALDQLPPLRGVILSHDHYDHLDRAAIRALAARAGVFVAPLGVGDLLRRWGVDADKVVQLDWWQSIRVGEVELTATPAQHFSGRGAFGRDRTLWASWAIQAPGLKLFFSGDSGYFPGFAEIGERLGPFDLSLIECGAYDPLWEGVHMLPEQTVQAQLDVRGRWLLPIHNATFDLAFHDWNEPMERVLAAAQARAVAISMPMLGQAVDAALPPAVERWWRLPAKDRAVPRAASAERAQGRPR
ncbi:MBL fold metallo-hydrolase [Stenotrophomonas sp. MMGLT7]|uniref:MBL fold metallo-hydrolase n=1 Tax=Stenotrophomonas sp. MMGLT7 TaxID=2901227 RepID=UPI001E4E25AD|nr:MBL fold metallo-hydrolase [Stenotrophomonas sp. MMGLT7]MCD7099601.1 MBL fold metallo-hydrolase [Stenotrophomonas sp. MMGLT7]